MKKPQLFLFHFAGGNCYSFQFLTPLLKEFEVIPLELPGRGRRIREELLTDFDQAAEDIYRQVAEKLTSPRFMIYGHSMGAYLALRVANMLEKENRMPAYVFVSGNPGPGIRENKNRYLMERKEFVEELRNLGGAPPEVLENDELLEFFIPILRADFEIAEKNELDNEGVLNAPIYAMMGTEEEQTEDIGNWGRFTRSGFKHTLLPGGHFFIYDNARQIAGIIKDSYRQNDLAIPERGERVEGKR